MTVNVVTPGNLGNDFDVGVEEPSKVHVNIDGTSIVRSVMGVLSAVPIVLTKCDGTIFDVLVDRVAVCAAAPNPDRRCFAYGTAIWGSEPLKWLDNAAFTVEVIPLFFPASLTLIGGYIKRFGQPVAPLTLPFTKTLILTAPAVLIDKWVGTGLGLAALDALVNSIPEFAAYGIVFHAGYLPYWALDYDSAVIEDLGFVLRDSSNGGLRSSDYVIRVGAFGYGDEFTDPVTQAEAEDSASLIYAFSELRTSLMTCVSLPL